MILANNSYHIFPSKVIWVIAYLLISLSFVFIANDNSFQFLLNTSSFYTDIFFSISITFTIGFYLHVLNVKLNKKYSWYEMFKTRLYKQFLLGVFLPLIFAMLLEIIYLKIINISFVDSAILNFELPLAFLFLVMLNLVFLADYLFKLKQKEIVVIKEQVNENTPKCLEFIYVQNGFVEEKIEMSNCALIVSASKLLWLKTFDGKNYLLQGTLEEWETKLKHSNFYRINRQYLASFKSIKNVEQTETRKLKVNFILPTNDVYISKPNVSSFRQWWKQ